MKPILEVENISKKFRIRHRAAGYHSLREQMMNFFKKESEVEDFLALEDISFEVDAGQSMGIIGRNGAGKSTLLKVLSRITPPSKGKFIARGRIASLLEVGTGFHPELTGRENIFFNGSLLGMKKSEIQSNFDAIVDFSGVEKFLDTPLKHYSSGMQLRLAFSVAAFLEPEILIIDEVLAVGDAEFQRKCLHKMNDVCKSGRTILFVSHNMAAVENLCSRAILLKAGNIVHRGKVSEVIDRYGQELQNESLYHYKAKDRDDDAYFTSIHASVKGEQPSHILELNCEIVSRNRHKDAFVAFDISNSQGVNIMQAIPVNEPFIRYSQDRQFLKVEIDLPPLIPDTYAISAWIGSHHTDTISWDREIVAFEIHDSPIHGRTFVHSSQNGFLVPNSRIVNG